MNFKTLNKARKKRIERKKWPWIADERNRGEVYLSSLVVVMDNSVDPKSGNRLVVSYKISEKEPEFHAGENTVAVFKFKQFKDQFIAFLNQTIKTMNIDPNEQNEVAKEEASNPTTGVEAQENVANDTEEQGDKAGA